MKKVELTDEQCKILEEHGNMVSFNMALPPNIIKEQIIDFLRSKFIDEDKIDEMADKLLSEFLSHTLENTQ